MTKYIFDATIESTKTTQTVFNEMAELYVQTMFMIDSFKPGYIDHYFGSKELEFRVDPNSEFAEKYKSIISSNLMHITDALDRMEKLMISNNLISDPNHCLDTLRSKTTINAFLNGSTLHYPEMFLLRIRRLKHQVLSSMGFMLNKIFSPGGLSYEHQ